MTHSSPNAAAKAARNKEADNPVSSCPLMGGSVQLIPLRYGLCEGANEQPDRGNLEMPYQTESKPLGIRLLRDGWLYIVVTKNDNTILHEYRIEQGIITQLLWRGSEVGSDERTNDVGEAKLIFSKCTPIFTAYSEVQWTAVKCSQVIKSASEREHFMQLVELDNIHAIKGGVHVLTPEQMQHQLAEVAPAPKTQDTAQAITQDQNYAWEHQDLYRRATPEELIGEIDPEHEYDYLYLVIRDDIGVLRDLANYQDLLVDHISQWAENEKQQKAYVEGCYIETLLEMNHEKLIAATKVEGEQYAQLKEELNDKQKQSIIDWVDATQQYGHHSVQAGKVFIQLRKTLGPKLSIKYQNFIFELESQYDKQLNGVSMWHFWDSSHGEKGIVDVIRRDEMQAFLAEQRQKLQEWNQKLDAVSRDRANLLAQFYHSAWYFDANSSSQALAALATEYACIKDICRNEQAIVAVQAIQESVLLNVVPLFYTQPKAELVALQKDISGKIKDLKASLDINDDMASINDTAIQINSLITDKMPSLNSLSEQMSVFYGLNQAALSPAMQLDLADGMENLSAKLNQGKALEPVKVLRDISHATWLSLLRAVSQTGVTLSFATQAQVQQFDRHWQQAQILRQENTQLKNRIREAEVSARRTGRQNLQVHLWRQNRKQNQLKLNELEPKLASAMTPVGEGPGKVGVQIQGLSSQQSGMLAEMVTDQQALKYGSRSFSPTKMDGLAIIVAVYQLVNAAKVMQDSHNGKEVLRTDLANAIFSGLGAGFGAAQGLAVTSNQHYLKQFNSAAAQLHFSASMGRLTAFTGFAAYGFTVLASGTEVIKQGEAFLTASQNGDTQVMLKAGVTLSVHSGLAGVNGWGLGHTTSIIREVMKKTGAARSAAWAANTGRLLSIGLRVNLVGIALSVLDWGVTAVVNHYNLNRRHQWLMDSAWGLKPKYISLQDSNLKLAIITQAPKMYIQDLQDGRAVILHFPGILTKDLNAAGVKLGAYWLQNHRRNDWVAASEGLHLQWQCLSKPDEALKMMLPILNKEANAEHGLGLVLHYRPTPEAFEPLVLYFQTEQLGQVHEIKQVGRLKARELNAPLIPLRLEDIT